MRALRNLPAALLACVLLAGAPAAAYGQKDGQKKDPPKEEKVVPRGDKQQPHNDDRPRDNNNNRDRDNNNKRPPFFSFF